MSDDRTRTLVEAVTRGDVPALEDLLADYLPRLHAYVRLRMGPALRAREGTLDVVQSVCREVLGDVRQGFDYRGESAFLGWLMQAALNKIRDRHRYHAAQKRDAAREADVEAEDLSAYASLLTPTRVAVGRESVERMERAFDQLSDEHREVIVLARGIGLSHAEIAERMGRSPGATRMLLGRALARLGELMDQSSQSP
ncbi:MAG: sigma-70 family RNA polymerase sigma factor [Planctomycetes bacterium]|nr:sigma-70 family RNA polymerase sigma factor [Planctomycetota bacterium]